MVKRKNQRQQRSRVPSQPEFDPTRARYFAAWLAVVVCAMIGLSFASVPLYDLFCRVTGFGGTMQIATQPSSGMIDQNIEIRFNADTARQLPWQFKPQQIKTNIAIGETFVAYYTATNNSDKAITGVATFNVTPNAAGRYLQKIACFCFTDQLLQPHQSVTMPISFYVDPAIVDDPQLKDLKTITLSYSFFRAQTDDLNRAQAEQINNEQRWSQP